MVSTSENILESSNLTLHDLSSVAAIIIGNVCYLFSSFLRTLATILRDYNPRTLTISYSSLMSYLILEIKSVNTNSFSIT